MNKPTTLTTAAGIPVAVPSMVRTQYCPSRVTAEGVCDCAIGATPNITITEMDTTCFID